MICAATREDLDDLLELERRCFGKAAWSRAGLASALGAPTAVALVVHLDSRLVAAALWSLVLDEAELLRIAVDPSTRRTGLARRLLAASEELLIQRGTALAHLEVRADNIGAISLYQSTGWETAGRRKDYYGDGCDAMLFTWDLRDSRMGRNLPPEGQRPVTYQPRAKP